MGTEVSVNNFKLPSWDGQKTGKVIIGAAIVGGLAWVFTMILPWLLSIVWGAVSLFIGAIILVPLVMILCSKKFWRGMNYLTQGLARKTLGWVIEMDPFEILYEQVEAKEKDIEQIKVNGDKLKGQSSKLTDELNRYDKQMRESAGMLQILNDKKAKNKFTDDDALEESTCGTDYTNAKSYVDQVKPILTGINTLIDFCTKAYRKSTVELTNAKNTIKVNKAQFEAVTTGNNAMQSAMKAFNGRTDLNNDADLALEKLRADIGQKIGSMKTAIEITSGVMNHIDLRDAARVAEAANSAIEFQKDPAFRYIDSVKGNNLQLDSKQVASSTSKSNSYLDY